MKRAMSIGAAVLLASCQPSPGGRAAEHRAKEPAREAQPAAGKRVVEIRSPAPSGGGAVATARYETVTLDPVLEEMRSRDEDLSAEQGKKTGRIRDEQKAKKEKERKEELVLRSSLPEDERPTSIDEFQTIWHNPPVAQYYTGTCWSFCTTSFMESEVERIAGREVKLSEMSTVYWEYLEKARGYVETRGDSLFAEGSQAAALVRAFRDHGAWPDAAYRGVAWDDGRHDHQRMVEEMESVLGFVEKNDVWDEQTVLGMIGVILDRDMGRPPDSFEYEGKATTPQAFATETCGLDPDDYVSFISTLEFPFWTRAEYRVPDNWWHDGSYHNVPLDDFYEGLHGAITHGYGAVLALDVSEPGKDAENDVMFIPEYDIPGDRIDQLAREYRFKSGVTSDDHGVHLVGLASHAGHDWFLIKDSGRSSRHGRQEGYYFVRDDYVRLKVLAFMVHRGAVEDLLARFLPKKAGAAQDAP